MTDSSEARSLAQILRIEFPPEAPVPAVLQDPTFVRYLIAGSLYTRGILSGAEARRLTGDTRRLFEENMARYGFPLMPDDPQTIAEELKA